MHESQFIKQKLLKNSTGILSKQRTGLYLVLCFFLRMTNSIRGFEKQIDFRVLRNGNRFNRVHSCLCGYFQDAQKPCTCAPAVVTKHQKRISGPLLDRMDIHVEEPRVNYEKLSSNRLGEWSESICTRVQAARNIQLQRFSKIELSNIVCNADMLIGEINGSFANYKRKVRA